MLLPKSQQEVWDPKQLQTNQLYISTYHKYDYAYKDKIKRATFSKSEWFPLHPDKKTLSLFPSQSW